MQPLGFRFHPLRRFDETLADRRQHVSARITLEQLDVECEFQPIDAPGYRSMARSQLASGRRKLSRAGHRQKELKIVPGEVRSSRPRLFINEQTLFAI